MRLRNVVPSLIACLAITAVTASVAHGAWTIEGKTLAQLGITSESVEVKSHNSKPLTLTMEFGTTLIEIRSQKVECTTGATCQIDENAVGDHSVGRLTFTEVTVPKQSGCQVHTPGAPNGTVTTVALTDQVIMDPKGGTATFDRFASETAETWFELEFTGELCPFSELRFPVKGTLCGRAVHTSGPTEDVAGLTGELFTEQGLTFNKAEQETGGCLLYLNNNKEKPMILDATVVNILSGPNADEKFGAD